MADCVHARNRFSDDPNPCKGCGQRHEYCCSCFHVVNPCALVQGELPDSPGTLDPELRIRLAHEVEDAP